MIQLSEQELRDLSRLTQQMNGYLGEVVQQVNTAVTGTDWRSQAAESFKERWTKDKSTLTTLAEALMQWSQELNQHAEVAHDVGSPRW
jgi:uncharacterized protein YukE